MTASSLAHGAKNYVLKSPVWEVKVEGLAASTRVQFPVRLSGAASGNTPALERKPAVNIG
jgi:hypothetical protein